MGALAKYKWAAGAACHHPDVDAAWFNAEELTDDETKALAVCANCPANIQAQCLATGMAIEERGAAGEWPIARWGFWGGTAPRDRHDLYLASLELEDAV